MGITTSLELVDPSIWNRAVEIISNQGDSLLDWRRADEFLQAFGRQMTDEVHDKLTVAIEGGYISGSSPALAALLCAAVSEKSWDLDKGIGFSWIAEKLPGGKPLARILHMNQFDIDAPENCRDPEGGIVGLFSVQTVAECLAIVRRFPDAHAVAHQLDTSTRGFWNRLTGRARSTTAARDAIRLDHYALIWARVIDAVEHAATRGRMLGVAWSM